MKAISIKGNSTIAIKTELEKSISDGFKPTLAIVFISVKQGQDAVSKLLDKKAFIFWYGSKRRNRTITK